MEFNFTVRGTPAPLNVSVQTGESLIFVGANGGGKTRLSVLIEESIGDGAHRISAHRALNMNPTVAKITEEQAKLGLRTGFPHYQQHGSNRVGHRWNSKAATFLLNDFDYLIQVLFADQSNCALATHQRVRAGDLSPAEATKFERLVELWQFLLPHRKLHITGDDILVSVTGEETKYRAEEMSDGERSIFYLIAQVLAVEKDSLFIVDEPELHIHRSLMSKLWDELEAARPDCAFIYITHDLEFAAGRTATKFVIKNYSPEEGWLISPVAADSGFDEQTTTYILGSRRPILFVEGTGASLDKAIYRAVYPDWTVIPKGSCADVIHSVVTLRNNAQFTRITCSGLVDADAYEQEDVDYFRQLGIEVLPVSEIENLMLLPSVSEAIARQNGYDGAELNSQLTKLSDAIFATLASREKLDRVVAQYCRRRIDRMLKKIDLSEALNVEEISKLYRDQTRALNISDIAASATSRIETAIEEQDLPKLLAGYDNKGLLALAASFLRGTRLNEFEQWLVRVMSNGSAAGLVSAMRTELPVIHPR